MTSLILLCAVMGLGGCGSIVSKPHDHNYRYGQFDETGNFVIFNCLQDFCESKKIVKVDRRPKP